MNQIPRSSWAGVLGFSVITIIVQSLILYIMEAPFVFVFPLIPIIIAGHTGDQKKVVIIALINYIASVVLIKACLSGPVTKNLIIFTIVLLLYLGIGILTSRPVIVSFKYKQALEKRKQAEKMLIEEKRKLNIILLSITDGIISTDNEKKITFMNHEAERLTGFSLDEARGESIEKIYRIINEDTKEKIDDPLERIAGRGKAVGFANHTILIAKNNKEIVIGDRGYPIKNEENDTVGFIITFRDLGYKKEYQNMLSTAKAQAIESERLAGIGQLAAGIAHEINNPMGFIQSNMETLALYITKLKELIMKYREEQDYEKVKKYEKEFAIDYVLSDLDDIIDENKSGMERISSIVRTLKDFAKVNNSAEWNLENLNNIINNVLLVVRNESKYTAEIILELKEDLPSTTFNTGEMNQVFLNLIMNALQAIKEKYPNGKGILSITTATENQYIVCHISDNGRGIRQNQLSRIFEPFYTTKAPGEGTGLGLHIVYNIIVKNHKGDILVKNNETGGALFTVKLPIVR